MSAIERRRRLVVAAGRDEMEISLAVHRGHAFKGRCVYTADLALELKGEIVDALGPVQICIDLRLVEVVEEENFSVASEEWLHGVAIVAADGHALKTVKFCFC